MTGRGRLDGLDELAAVTVVAPNTPSAPTVLPVVLQQVLDRLDVGTAVATALGREEGIGIAYAGPADRPAG